MKAATLCSQKTAPCPPSHQISFESSSLWFPLEAEVLARLRLVPHHRDESILVEEVAFQWQHIVILVTMLLQRLSKLSQQIAVDFPDMGCKGHKLNPQKKLFRASPV